MTHLMENHLRQKTWILSLALLVLVAGQSSLTLLSNGFVDEVSYINPGASWALGDGFVSNMWYAQEVGKTWAGSTPGMPFIYGLWFKFAGFGAFQSKLLSLVFHMLGVATILLWARRFHRMSLMEVFALGCLLLALPSLIYAGTSCRLEVFALLFFGWFLWVSFPPEGHESKWYSCILMGASSALIGAHFIGYYALAFGAVFLVKRSRHAFRKGALVACGMATSLAGIFVFHSAAGTWEDFVQSRVYYMAAENTKKMTFLLHGLEIYAPTPDILLLGVACIIALLTSALLRRELPGGLRNYIFAAAICLLVPPYISKIGLFQSCYAWMVGVPVTALMIPLARHLVATAAPSILAMTVACCVASYSAVCVKLVSGQMDNKAAFSGAASYLIQNAEGQDSMIITQDSYYLLRPRFSELFMRSNSSKKPGLIKTEIIWIINRRSVANAAALNEGGTWDEVYVSTAVDRANDPVVVLRKIAKAGG